MGRHAARRVHSAGGGGELLVVLRHRGVVAALGSASLLFAVAFLVLGFGLGSGPSFVVTDLPVLAWCLVAATVLVSRRRLVQPVRRSHARPLGVIGIGSACVATAYVGAQLAGGAGAQTFLLVLAGLGYVVIGVEVLALAVLAPSPEARRSLTWVGAAFVVGALEFVLYVPGVLRVSPRLALSCGHLAGAAMFVGLAVGCLLAGRNRYYEVVGAALAVAGIGDGVVGLNVGVASFGRLQAVHAVSDTNLGFVVLGCAFLVLTGVAVHAVSGEQPEPADGADRTRPPVPLGHA